MTTTTTIARNVIAGTDAYSHEVPSSEGVVVTMRDGAHKGTSVWRADDGFYFASHDGHGVAHAERVVLLRNPNADELDWPCACDLGWGDGLAMIGIGRDDDLILSEGEELLWDSARDL